jgi:hypothetical protein
MRGSPSSSGTRRRNAVGLRWSMRSRRGFFAWLTYRGLRAELRGDGDDAILYKFMVRFSSFDILLGSRIHLLLDVVFCVIRHFHIIVCKSVIFSFLEVSLFSILFEN